MDTATKTGMDTAKTASKMVLQKTEKLQEIGLETKQLIKSLQQVKQKVKKRMVNRVKDKKFTYHQKKRRK